MISLKKIPSVESYDVDGSTLRQVIHFEFDAGFYDLYNSCVELTTSIVPIETTPAQIGVHNVSLTYPPIVFVKNAQMSCDKGGILEDVSNVNFREINMRKFTRSTAENESLLYIDGQNQVDEFGNNHSNFRTLYRSGTTNSVVNKPVLRIPLRELFSGIGSMPQYPPNVGKTRLELEFQAGTMMLQEYVKYDAHATNSLACDNIAAVAAGQDITSVVITPTYDTQNQVPLWVGQKLSIQFTANAIVDAKDVLITGLSRDDTSGKVTVSFANMLTTVFALTLITIIELGAASLAYKIESPQLLLFQIQPSPSQASSAVKKLRNASIPFRTWSLEMDNLTETAEYNRQFYLEPNCNSAMLMFREDADKMDSASDELYSSRNQLNQVDLTNTDVVQESPLWKDRIMWSVLNSNLPFKKLTNSPVVVFNPIPAVNQQQQFSVQLKSEAGGADIDTTVVHLYKQLNKVLKISKGRVMVTA